MDIQVNFAVKVPLRDQLVEQIKLRVAKGQLRPGEQLPTVRDLARSLVLNPGTVSKAYGELERSGVILTRRGGGSFVADHPDARFLMDSREDRLNALLTRAALEGLSLGYQPDEVEARFVALLSRWRSTRHIEGQRQEPKEQQAQGMRFAGSHDLALEILFGRLCRAMPECKATARYGGSLSGLIALEQGTADIAGTHLLDEETGEYNLPFVRRLLPGQAVLVMTLVERWQGLLVPRGNPKGIDGLASLTRADVTFVNRQRGAGTRVLLDYRLRQLAIAGEQVRGYEREEETHVGVAAAVADGSADLGLGIESAARAAGLDFLPLIKERYDLVALVTVVETPWFSQLREIVESEEFQNVVKTMGGYDTALCGRIVGS